MQSGTVWAALMPLGMEEPIRFVFDLF